MPAFVSVLLSLVLTAISTPFADAPAQAPEAKAPEARAKVAAPDLRVTKVVTGLDNVPPEGPVIIAANHVSFADEIFTPLAARRQIVYFAKAEYFTTPGLRGKAMAAFFNGLGQVPVARADPRSAASVIEIGVDVLTDGRALGIYPEGTRSPDGRLHKFRTGVARVALRSGAPVVPVGLRGTRDVGTRSRLN